MHDLARFAKCFSRNGILTHAEPARMTTAQILQDEEHASVPPSGARTVQCW
ncbi:MAG TPA: hypothetical protein VMA36_13905 [Candidatus Limnocylindria bacterium]|nr:hypothetical protein [Candidatus Limnocylindria bacterium]